MNKGEYVLHMQQVRMDRQGVHDAVSISRRHSGHNLICPSETRNSAKRSLIFHPRPSPRCNIILSCSTHDCLVHLPSATATHSRSTYHISHVVGSLQLACQLCSALGSLMSLIKTHGLSCSALTALNTQGHARASGLVIVVLVLLVSRISNCSPFVNHHVSKSAFECRINRNCRARLDWQRLWRHFEHRHHLHAADDCWQSFPQTHCHRQDVHQIPRSASDDPIG